MFGQCWKRAVNEKHWPSQLSSRRVSALPMFLAERESDRQGPSNHAKQKCAACTGLWSFRSDSTPLGIFYYKAVISVDVF